MHFPQVGAGCDFTLFALDHGRVFITTEKVHPNWNHSWVKRFFGMYKDTDSPIFKKYVHVIPIPMEKNFKLVDQL